MLVGYYRTLAQLLHIFDIGVPASAEAQVIRLIPMPEYVSG